MEEPSPCYCCAMYGAFYLHNFAELRKLFLEDSCTGSNQGNKVFGAGRGTLAVLTPAAYSSPIVGETGEVPLT